MRLVGKVTTETCGNCNGRGKVPAPENRTVRTGSGPMLTPEVGKPIPCPVCRGKKVVTR